MNLHDNWNRDFDRSFAKMEKNVGRVSALVVVAWILFVLVDLAILAGIVFVAVHFLSKVW